MGGEEQLWGFSAGGNIGGIGGGFGFGGMQQEDMTNGSVQHDTRAITLFRRSLKWSSRKCWTHHVWCFQCCECFHVRWRRLWSRMPKSQRRRARRKRREENGGAPQFDLEQALAQVTPEQSLFLGGLLSGVLGSVGPIMSGVSSVVSASLSGGGGCGHGCQKARRRRARRKRREENGGAPQFD